MSIIKLPRVVLSAARRRSRAWEDCLIRIVYVTMFSPETGGGIGRVAYELAQQFATTHEVAIICGAERTAFRYDQGVLHFSIESSGEDQMLIPVLSTPNVNAIVGFLNAFRPEVIHAHEPVLVAQLAQIWAQMHGVPFVYTAHIQSANALKFGGAELMGVLRSPIAESVVKRYLMSFYRHCDAVVALNRYAQADLAKFGYRGRVFTIPNGRFLRHYANCPYADLHAESKTLTFVGFITERKNQIYLLDMLAMLPHEYRLCLVGESLSDGYARRFAERLEALGLQDRVELLGQVSHEQIPAVLQRSHCFVSASKAEVQSLAVIEALASGTPVIGLGNETVDELVDENVGRRLDGSTTPMAFAEAVRAVCEQDAKGYLALCQAARKRVAHLDWANICQQTEVAYQALRELKVADVRGVRHPSRPTRRRVQRLALEEERLLTTWHKVNKASHLPWLLAGATMTATLAWKVWQRSLQANGNQGDLVNWSHLRMPKTAPAWLRRAATRERWVRR